MNINHLSHAEVIKHLAQTSNEIKHINERISYLKSPRFPADSSTPSTIRAYGKLLNEALILHDRLTERMAHFRPNYCAEIPLPMLSVTK